jgi:hypothetical protein
MEPLSRRSCFETKPYCGVVTFNLVFLISKPLKILINSCQTLGGILLISEIPFMLAHECVLLL